MYFHLLTKSELQGIILHMDFVKNHMPYGAIAHSQATPESLSAQKDEIIHSMNVQLRDLAKLESVSLTEPSELMT